MWLAETLLVDGEQEIVRDLRSTLHTAAERSAEEETAVRLRVAVADADGDWVRLLRDAGAGRVSPSLASLVHSRYGRWLAWNAEPESSEDAYSRAIIAAAEAGLPADAAANLYDIRTVRALFFPLREDDWHPRALALAGEHGSFLKQRSEQVRFALQDLFVRPDRSGPTAHRAFRRAQWEARMSGHFAAELSTYALLASLHTNADDFGVALEYAIRAGDKEQAVRVARRLERPVHSVWAVLDRPTPWEVATALAVLTAWGDLLTSSELQTYLPKILHLMEGRDGGLLDPKASISLGALNVLSAASLQVSEDQVDVILEKLQLRIGREPAPFADAYDAVGQALIGLYRAHAEKRQAIGDMLVRFATAPRPGGLMGQNTRELIASLGKLAHGMVPTLRDLADQGDAQSIELLARLEEPHPAVVAAADLRVEQVLVQEAQRQLLGTDAPLTAVFARCLPQERCVAFARRLVEMARDPTDLVVNRAGYLGAAAMIADKLSSEVRAELFEVVIRLVDRDAEVSPRDHFMDATLHALSRSRMNIATGDLPWAALRAGALLAETPEQRLGMDALAWSVLHTTDRLSDHHVRMIAAALGVSHSESSELTDRVLASHPNPRVRQAAATVWARQPKNHPEVGDELAADPNVNVRLALAIVLSDSACFDPDHVAEIRARLSTDSSAMVRWAATATAT